mmetsp:Transcript_28128/g.73735  ORF Transcript_28128/g.73735 Transcript_28128/m.73735 type:complete len:977 (-) Transcript_28128:80-3010(-)|eukprot:CAMPEP_0182917300 /NCGR_PEP_ID=MMETSP0105_2-20130417/1439_1 /TAXON_ID=81532 ORGANISM="Acanthoeca-like sp., Strain 10tr" /NCGR_SAMPLE_ID=MMETSP0105_2 /ASSEMBLY_ACC=CAM_ASM_000205 /LENGTH=976 /DNA_ID=CAMNT_0025054297 /DNA_START=264 /DNA_END=3194 /DNA_ORIENTATION=+
MQRAPAVILCFLLDAALAQANERCSDATSTSFALPSNTTVTAGCADLARSRACGGAVHGSNVRQACPRSCCECDAACIAGSSGSGDSTSNNDEEGLTAGHIALIVVIVVALLIALFLIAMHTVANRRKDDVDIVLSMRGVADFQSVNSRRGSTPYVVTLTDGDDVVDGNGGEGRGEAWATPSPLSPQWDDTNGDANPADSVAITRSAVRGAARDAGMSAGQVDFNTLRGVQDDLSHDERAKEVAANFERFCEGLDDLVGRDDGDLEEVLSRYYSVRELTSKVRLDDLRSTVDIGRITERGSEDFWGNAANALIDPSGETNVMDFLEYCVAEVRVLDAEDTPLPPLPPGAASANRAEGNNSTPTLQQELAAMVDLSRTITMPPDLTSLSPRTVADGETYLVELHNALVRGRWKDVTNTLVQRDHVDIDNDPNLSQLASLHDRLTSCRTPASIDSLQKHYCDAIGDAFALSTGGDGEPLERSSGVTATMSEYVTWVELQLANVGREDNLPCGIFFDFITRKCLNAMSRPPSSAARRSSGGSVETVGDDAKDCETIGIDSKLTERTTKWDSPLYTQDAKGTPEQKVPRMSLGGIIPGDDTPTDAVAIHGVERAHSQTEDELPPTITPKYARALSRRSLAPSPLDATTSKHPQRVNLMTGRAHSFRHEVERGRVTRVVKSIRTYVERLEKVANASHNKFFPENVATTLIPVCFSDIQQAYSIPIASLQEELEFLYKPMSLENTTEDFGIWTSFAWSGFWMRVQTQLDTENDGRCVVKEFIMVLTEVIRKTHQASLAARREAGKSGGRIVYIEGHSHNTDTAATTATSSLYKTSERATVPSGPPVKEASSLHDARYSTPVPSYDKPKPVGYDNSDHGVGGPEYDEPVDGDDRPYDQVVDDDTVEALAAGKAAQESRRDDDAAYEEGGHGRATGGQEVAYADPAVLLGERMASADKAAPTNPDDDVVYSVVSTSGALVNTAL